MIEYRVKARLARNIGTDDFILEAFDKTFALKTPIESRKEAFNYYFNVIDVMGKNNSEDDISTIIGHIHKSTIKYFKKNGKLEFKLIQNAPKELGIGIYLVMNNEEFMIHGYNDDERELDIARNLVKEIELYENNKWNTSNWLCTIKYWDYEIATSSKDGIIMRDVLWTPMDFWEHGKPSLFIDVEEEKASEERDSFLLNIIGENENRNLEFKSSLRFCKKQKSPQSYIEHGILKTITAFANTEGGTLLIGINDDCEIVGIRDDINSFTNKSKDEFLLHFDGLIKNNFTEPIDALLSFEFYKAKSEWVFMVNVEPSTKPRFLKTKSKGTEFFIRRSASSCSLDIEEAVKYCFDKWPPK